MTIFFFIIFEILCRPGVIQGEGTNYILSGNPKDTLYYEVDLKEGVYKYISQDKKDTSIIVIEKNNFHELGKTENRKIQVIK